MLNSYFKTVIGVVVIISAFLTGCTSDNTVTPPGSSTVNGKIVDFRGAGIGGATVWIDSNIATSNFDGTFSINNIEAPYNVKVVQTDGPNSYGYYFENISNFSPNLYVQAGSSSAFQGTFNITIPPMVANQRASVFVTDNGSFQNNTQINFPTTNTILNMTWNEGNQKSAKIIVLVYTMVGGDIVSYDKYGEKDTVITSGGTVNYTFTAPEVSLDPGEASISGNVVLPGGYSVPKATTFILFAGQGSLTTRTLIGNQLLSNAFALMVPTGLPTTPKVGIFAEGSGNDGQYVYENFQLLPGSAGNNLNLSASPVLGTPINNATGVNLMTDFSFSAGSGTGMYFIYIDGVTKDFVINTNNTGFKIPDFSQFGLSMVNGETYSWTVAKVISVGSVNDFVSTSLNSNTSYSGVSTTQSRTFTFGN